jgi:hypothetical protein
LELLAAAAFLATLVSGFAVGGSLLQRARSTHRAAAGFLGTSVTLLALAAAVELGAMQLAERGRVGVAYPVEALALFLHSTSASSLCFGIWRVFYPERRSAFYACAALSAVLFDSWMAVILPGRHTSVTGFTIWFHLHVASRAAAPAWGAAAAWIHHRRLRSRLALGLAEPFAAHRFLLWAVALASNTGILITALLTNTLRGVLVFAWSPALLAVSVLGLVAAAALWLAFLPPAAYRRGVEPRPPAALI